MARLAFLMHYPINETLHTTLTSDNTPNRMLSDSKILVIDDSPDNLRVLSSALAKDNYDVRCAKSGSMAFKAMETTLPDLILLDIRMPNMDGYEVCQRLKANPATREIPVIFISALDEAFDKVKAFKCGGVDFITKPFQVEEVLIRVCNQLELQSARTRLAQLNNELEQRVLQRTRQLQAVNQRLKASEESLESILNTVQDVIWSATLEPFQILYLNPAAATVYQRPARDFLTRSTLWFEIVYPDDHANVMQSMKALTSECSFDIEYRILRPNGEIRWVRNRSRLIIIDDIASIRIEGIVTDISDRKRAEQQLLHDALHDGLTQLPNRKLFIEHVERALKRKKRQPDYTFAVLFIDLDRFKIVNDSLGHATGDRLLVEVAKRIRQCIRQYDIAARLGGDEFTVLLDEIADTSIAINCVQRIQTELNLPIDINGNTVFTGSSIGIVIASEAYTSAADLLRDADIAMYRAKEAPKSSYELFDQVMFAQSMRRLQLENKLRVGLGRGEFQLYYQPIISLSDQRLLGFEALIRWQHPDEGIINPIEFIHIAEETGLIIPLGAWVLEQACWQIKQWQQRYENFRHLKINVNVASQQIREPTLVDTLDRILHKVGISGCDLRLEITESTLMEQTKDTIKTLSQIRQRQIQISIDDFGTGYSSLSYLSRFPINNLKIDQSFVGQMHVDSDSFEIVRTITTLAHSLNINITAEGIEHVGQCNQLIELGCELGQGYFFSPPLNITAAEALLSNCSDGYFSAQ